MLNGKPFKGSLNGKIVCLCKDVWGFDEEAVKVLKDMKPPDTEELIQKFAILLNQDSELLPQNIDGKQNVSRPYSCHILPVILCHT